MSEARKVSSPRPWRTRRNNPLACGPAVVGAGGKHTSPPFDDLDGSQDDDSQGDGDFHLDDLDLQPGHDVSTEKRGERL